MIRSQLNSQREKDGQTSRSSAPIYESCRQRLRDNHESRQVILDDTILDPDMVENMMKLATGRTRDALQDRFGISYNTWRKVLAGQPLRRSVVARLEERIRKLQDAARMD